MIRRLRIKFIGVSMLSILLVLSVIIGTINLFNYERVIEDANNILAILKEYNGSFPKDKDLLKRDENYKKSMSPEVAYESRYFSVLLDSNSGMFISVDTGKVVAIDEESAIQYAQKIWKSSKQEGFISNYRYVKQNLDGQIRIIFLDCRKNLSTFRSFLMTSVLVSVLGLVSVFILVVLFSKRVMKPVYESYEKQKRFITDAGHEIKTPLTIIDANATILEMEYGENEWIDDIQKQTKRLAELTNDLIYLSRMEEESNRLQMIDFPFSDIVSEMVMSFQNIAKTQNKIVISKIQPMLTYHGDEKSIRQLISILLDNALKYSNQGSEIVVSVEKQGKGIQFSIFNETESLEKERLDKLFDRFYRMEQSRNTQTGGYGIGLSIAKAVVTAHKGKITASSQDGKSLLITVNL